MNTSSPTAVRTTDSSDRNPTIPAARGTTTPRTASSAARSGGLAKRFVSALMRSLAASHV